MRVRKKDIERFHRSYAANTDSGCWEWLLSKNHNGYGRFKLPLGSERAHRVSYVIHNGPIPLGMIVCHSCDNPKCVNPGHLWLGTNMDNQRDMISKGRKRSGDQRGEKNARSVLDQEKVGRIVGRIAEGGSNKEIALEFKVSHSTISLIRRGKIWTDVPRPEQHAAKFDRYASLR